MNNNKHNIPKIFYNGEEIEEVHIGLGNLDFDNEIYITPFYEKEHQMKPDGVHLVYKNIRGRDDESKDDDVRSITYWSIKDNQDKITIDQNDASIMIKWIEGNDNRVKQSLFIPMERIFHILTGEPFGEGEEDISK